MSEDSILHEFCRADQAAVQDLILRGLRDRFGDSFDPTINNDLDDIWRNYIEKGANVVGLTLAGEVVATGILMPISAHVGRLLRISVHLSHRRRGLGRAIVAHLVERAADRGMGEVRVSTESAWADAVAFYLSCGFRIWEKTDEVTWLVKKILPVALTELHACDLLLFPGSPGPTSP